MASAEEEERCIYDIQTSSCSESNKLEIYYSTIIPKIPSVRRINSTGAPRPEINTLDILIYYLS
jgi:hypothetical protein